MISYKNLSLILIISIFSLNILATTYSMLEENLGSDESIPALLRGIGLKGQKKETYYQLPRLLNSSHVGSQIYQSYSNGIHCSQSQYSVPGWVDTRWRYRRNITIDYTQVSGSGSHSNFPILIDFYDSDLRTEAQIDVGDIFFTNSSGEKLNHEIELYDRHYNSTHTHLVAWINIPTLYCEQETVISMYWGNPIAGNQENPEGVWAGYEGVWHLEEPNGSGSYILDSTENAHDGTPSGTQFLESGMIGGARNFTGSGGNSITMTGGSNIFNGDSAFTFSFWIYPNYASDSEWESHEAGVFVKAQSISMARLYRLSYFPAGKGNFQTDIRFVSAGTQHEAVGIDRQQWNYITYTFSGTQLDKYVNGQNVGTKNLGNDNLLTDTSTFLLGSNSDAFKGYLDEYRAIGVDKSADWITTEFTNQLDPETFYSWDLKEEVPIMDDWTYPLMRFRKNISIDATNVPEDLINFPVLVDIYDPDLHDTSKAQTDGDDIVFAGKEDWVWSDELLTNGGFESGSLTGWTTSGNWQTVNETPIGYLPPQSGDYCIYNDPSTSSDFIQQDVSLSDYIDSIDSNKAVVNISAWMVSDEYPDQDKCRIKIEYLDNFHSLISTALDTGLQEPESWTRYSIEYNPIPANTRYIRVWATSIEDGWSAGTLDSFSVAVGVLGTNPSGFKLFHEIELFDQTGNGTHAHLVAWVRVPRLSSVNDTTITIYYGNNAVRSQSNSEGVWGSNYVGVYHLNNNPSTTTYDSTSGNHDGTGKSSMTSDDLIAGKIGNAVNFDGSGNDKITIQYNESFDVQDLTISAWIRVPSSVFSGGEYQWVSHHDHRGYGWVGMIISNQLQLRIYDPSYSGLTSGTDHGIVNDTWTYIVSTFSRPTGILYLNGSELLSSNSMDSTISYQDPTETIAIGGPADSYSTSMFWWLGDIDELRISSVARSVNWTATEYINQHDPDSFYNVSSEEEYIKWWADASFTNRRDIVIPKEKISGNLTDFPVFIDIDDSSLKIGSIQDDAADLLFTTANGTKLDHETEYFSQNIAKGHLVAWVRLPSLTESEDTCISMYYGNNDLVDQENPTCVWDNGYSGVWHLHDSSGNAQDSTSYGHEGVISGGVTQGATGHVDGAYYFDGIDSNVSMGDPSDGHLDFGTGSFTVETWINRDSTMSSTQYGGIFKGNGDVDDNPGWLIRFKGSDSVRFSAGDGTASVFNIHKSSILVDDTWMHFVGVLDRNAGEAYLYQDGQKIATDSATNGNIDSSYLFRISEDWDSAFHFEGLFDEIRISNIARSFDWIATEYQNQYNPASFYSVGSAVVFDSEPPVINDFGVDDIGTGIGKFWASISDTTSSVSSAEISINSTKYTMSFNGSLWIYQLPVIYQENYVYQITNASDVFGNHLQINTSEKNHTFSYDVVKPNILARYFDHKFTFTTNVSDSWGTLDTVIVNVTYHSDTMPNPSYWVMTNYQNFSGIMGYIRDNASMKNGDIKYQIFVNDTVGNYDISSITESYVYVNHPPIAGNLTLTPSPIYSNSTLVLTYDYYDDETPDYESGTEICWYRNNGSGFQLHSSYLYPADGTLALERDTSEIFRDDQWYATVIPKDGELFGDMVNSTTITVLNTPPSPSNVEIEPLNPLTVHILTIEYTYSDYDGDNETFPARQIEWYKVGSGHLPSFDNQTSISSDQTMKGDEYYVRLRVNDGTSYSNWVNSSHVFIKNSLPEAVNLTITPAGPTTLTTLVASWDMDDADIGDTENKNAAIIFWYKNGQLQASWSNSTSIGSGNTTKNEWWHFKVRIFDGNNYSALTESPHIQILNTPPTASNVATTINPMTMDDLTASWTFNDVDTGDTEPADSWIIRWFKDNQLQADYNNMKTVPASATSKGEVWNYTLQVFDGTNYSIQYTSSVTTILNSPPTASDLTITTNPTTIDDLIATWTATDVDGDNPDDYLDSTYIKWYNWTGGGWVELISAQNSTFLGWGNTSKGEVWRYTLRIFDGTNYSISEYTSTNTTIINSIPNVITPAFNKTTDVTTVDTINITYTYSDADDDPENTTLQIVYWFTNGGYNTSKFNNVTLYDSETKSGDFWQYIIRVYDGSTWSQNFTSVLVVIGSAPNNIPEVQNLTLTANTNTTTENLVLDYDYLDADGHLQSNREIFWYKDGLLQPELNDSMIIGTSLTSKDEVWNCTMRVFDGLNWSIFYNSNNVTILNTAPTVSELSVTETPTTSTDLAANWVGSDDDDGDILTYNITWYLNGIFNSSWETSSTSAILMAGNTTKNDKWYFSINASDGESFSSIVSLTSNVTILNTPPQVDNLTITTNPTTTDDLIAEWDDYDIDDDTLVPLIQWYMNNPGLPVPGLGNQTTVEEGNTSKNEVWWFSVQVHDGEDYSTIYESMHIQIQNTAPLNTTTLPLPTERDKENGITLNLVDILNSLEDPDGDNIEITEIRWYRGVDLQSDLNDSLNVPGSRLTKGEFWYYSILPYDGLDYGEIYASENFEISNSKPIISVASFVETEARTIHNLTIYYEADDADHDSMSVAGVTWYWYDTSIPDWVPNGTYANMLVLPNTATIKGDRWYFEIQVTDGTNVSDWKSSALQITILNSKPWVDPYSISITGGTTTSESLNLTYSWYDDDPEDSEAPPSITWETAVGQIPNDLTTLNYTNTKAGERWWISIKPHDGEEFGELVISKYYGINIIIGNTPPVVVESETAIEGLFNGTTYYGASFGTNFDLFLRYNASDIDGTQGVGAYDIVVIDGYVVGSEYRWYRNRSGVTTLISALNGETTVTSLYSKEGDVWWASIQPRDFYGDYGLAINSTKITIGNTAPLILDLQWTEITYLTTNDLSFQYTFYDYDTDDIESPPTIYWYRDGTLIPQYNDHQTIPSQVTNKTEIWYVNISVCDGEAYSIWYQLPNIIILNTPPSTTDVLLLPIFPNTKTDLVATWNFTDPDGDLENVPAAMIEWYRNGEYVGSFTSVPASMTNRGERWFFTINVTDGYDYSTRYQSNTITIINSAPTVSNILINNDSLIYTTDTLEVTWEFYDIDSIDVESSRTIIWYMDGEIQSQFTNQSSIPMNNVNKEQEWQVVIAVKDTGGLWSETVYSPIVIISNSRPTITIYNTSHPEFIVEDETLQIISFYLYSDADGDEPSLTIRWYLNGMYNPAYDNQTTIPADYLKPGDIWNYKIWPHDGVEFGVNKTSPVISIESRPRIHNFSAIPLSDEEGLFDLEVNVTDPLNNTITQVEFLLYINSTSEELASFIQTSPVTDLSSIWVYPFELSNYSYLNTFVLVNVTVVTEVDYSKIYSIRSTYSFNFTLEDKAPPRVITAYFIKDDEINPTNLTFFAEVVEYGFGIKEVILYYYFKAVNDSNGGEGAEFLQNEQNWLEAHMMYQDSYNDVANYSVTVTFFHNKSDTDIIYRIFTEDVAGNSHFAFDVRDFPDKMYDQQFNYQPPGLPEWVLLAAGLVIFVIFIGSIVYVKFIRKPELVGLDKDLVLKNRSGVSEAEIMATLDAHTIGVVVSFFDQRHGPIPIIVLPEILKDNFSKLVDLSDRSFSGTGFSDDFSIEIPSSYDFVLAQGLRTSVMSFGFSLERPEARGGQENLTCNILIHKEIFPLVNQFLDEIQREVHTIHVNMDKDPSNKNKIRREVLELRKYLSSIIISYEHIYGTTELLTPDS